MKFDFSPFSPITVVDLFARIFLFLFSICYHFVISYYIFVPLFTISNNTRIVFYVFLPIYCIVAIIWYWAYVRTSWLDAGSLARELHQKGFLDEDGNLHDLTTELEALPRCEKCGLPKPQRTHHCSICKKCYFRFDHHCPAMGNCIALYNMKSFLLVIFYSTILFIIGGILLVIAVSMGYNVPLVITIIIEIVIVVIIISLVSFGYSYIPQICSNITTLETIANVEPSTFNEGKLNNFKQIFGNSICLWFFPTLPPVSGFEWSHYLLNQEV